jgi:cyclopropane fatty-acyl-phospholipid synthase-like methyltransferase
MNYHTQQRYVLGHAPEEPQRLIFQATILRPITARLLHEAGIGPDMRVLDLGCGVGDVTMLVAEMSDRPAASSASTAARRCRTALPKNDL